VRACHYGHSIAGSSGIPSNFLAATVYADRLVGVPGPLKASMRTVLALPWACTGIGSIYPSWACSMVRMRPMFARRPLSSEGGLPPVLWSALLYSIMHLLNPLLASRIDCFVYGFTDSLRRRSVIVVVRQERVSTRENRLSVYALELKLPESLSATRSAENLAGTHIGIPVYLWRSRPILGVRLWRASRPNRTRVLKLSCAE